jgi:hypothetical protein
MRGQIRGPRGISTMFLSWLPVMMRSPSGSHTAEVTSAECCLTTSMHDPFATFHIRSEPSLPAQTHVASHQPPQPRFVHEDKHAAKHRSYMLIMNAPQVASFEPSGLQATKTTGPEWPRRVWRCASRCPPRGDTCTRSLAGDASRGCFHCRKHSRRSSWPAGQAGHRKHSQP